MAAWMGHVWVVRAVGWTLLHFCWQGLAVAGLLWCLLGLFSGRAARMRYMASCCALLLMVAAPAVTFCLLAAEARRAGLQGPVPSIDWVITVVPGGAGGGHWMEGLAGALDAAAPWLPWVWMVGVVLFLARLQVGLVVARAMKTEGTERVSAELARRFEELKWRVGVRGVVRLVHSARVQVPTVIGWLRPVVLMPIGCLASLSTAQVEALLAHELAHIRRHDYLVSVAQAVVEALLFYHPAVWWVSKQVRMERECRCDAVAVEAGGNALEYAKALSFLETRRAVQPELALGANGGVLTMRIKRMLGYQESTVGSQGAAFALLAVALVLPSGYVATMAHAQQAAVQADSALNRQYRAWLDEDVKWIIASDERKAFLALQSDPARDQFIAQFWARRDTEPGTYREEHYRRIAYANAHFGGTVAGWKSDRGHAYIAYGRPESIDSHPADAAPWEVWHYPSIKGVGDNVDLKFVDSCRCGEYTLSSQPKMSSLKHSGGMAPVSYVIPPAHRESADQEQAHSPVKVSDGVMAGHLLSRVDPVYPEIAKRAAVQGAVVLRAIISKEGTMENLQVLSGPEELRGSAIDAVRQWVYKPYLLNGAPTEVDTNITVNYSLNGEGTTAEPGSSAGSGMSSGEGASQGGVAQVPDGVIARQLVSRVNPVYPAEAKAAGVEGAVALRAVIGTDGAVKNLRIVSGPKELWGSAIDAVRQWVYKPYLLNGKPTEVETTITVNYGLSGMSSAPKRIGNGVTGPKLVHAVDPEYTEAARKAKLAGNVLVSLVVDQDGDPTQVKVKRGLGNELDEKALEAVRRYKFKPGTENGKPVDVALLIEVNFEIF